MLGLAGSPNRQRHKPADWAGRVPGGSEGHATERDQGGCEQAQAGLCEEGQADFASQGEAASEEVEAQFAEGDYADLF